MDHLHNSLIKFSKIAHSQEEKGIEKYGQGLNPLDPNYCWLDMAIEEIVDGFKYLHAEQVKRQRIVDQIRGAIKHEVKPSKHDEISSLLDKLEGVKK